MRALVAMLAIVIAGVAGCGSTRRTPHTENIEATTREAQRATKRGDWETAADRWYAVFLSGPTHAVEPCKQTAIAMMRMEDSESANHVLELGLQDNPNDPDLLELKGDVLVDLGFRRAAEHYYERTLELEPKRVSALTALARVRIALGIEGAAVEPLERAISLSGGDYATYKLLAEALRASGDPCKAFGAYMNAFRLGEGTVDDMVSAAALATKDQVCRADADAMATCVRWLERAVERDPQCTRGHFLLGVLDEERGDVDSALAHYRRAVETDPSCLMALTNLAMIYSARKDEANTREMVQRAMALEENNNRRRALQRLLEPFEKQSPESAPPGQSP